MTKDIKIKTSEVDVKNKITPEAESKITTGGDKSQSAKSNKGTLAWGQPPADFTKALAKEIVKSLSSFGQMTSKPFRRNMDSKGKKKEKAQIYDNPVFVDTSILIDGRILPIVNSGFLAGTFLVPQFVLSELQHIADSSDSIRRAKGRRGLDVVGKLKSQKANKLAIFKVIAIDDKENGEVDAKLAQLAKKMKARLLTVDFNLAQLARAQGIKVININDLAQALKTALIPGEEVIIQITHAGKERQQGVGYLPDGTMVVVEDARDLVGSEINTVVTKVHQTPAGQLFFARIK